MARRCTDPRIDWNADAGRFQCRHCGQDHTERRAAKLVAALRVTALRRAQALMRR